MVLQPIHLAMQLVAMEMSGLSLVPISTKMVALTSDLNR